MSVSQSNQKDNANFESNKPIVMENNENVHNKSGEIADSTVVEKNSKKGGEAVVIGDEVNLQDAFAKFRAAKIRERKLRIACKESSKGVRSEEFKNQLREKFVAQCRKYYGVPYHEKYRGDKPLAPLYLDCCGLIRQVMRDLAEDFGFIQGKWNQAYQFDCCPKEVAFEDLRPGDLIFYEGTYCSKRSKVQKHDMVHVEVFVGGDTGEATVGARFQKGVVQEFPSYKFPSTLWNLKKFHFRSLDTWLEGKCESHCPDHLWQSQESILATAAGKKSIFNDDEDDDVSAGCPDEDDDINGDDNELNKSLDKSLSFDAGTEGVLVNGICGDSTEGDEGQEELMQDNKAIGEEPLTIVPPTEMDELPHGVSWHPPVTPTKSAAATPQRKTPSKASTMSLKRSTTKPLPSPAPSAEPITSSKTPTRGPRLRVSKSLEMKKSLPKTYFVQKANGWKLVKAALDKRGWQQLPFDYNFSNRFGLKWVERRGQIDYKAHSAGQLVCHIPNNDVICTKKGLLDAMRMYYKRDYDLPWMMQTYDLDVPADCIACVKDDDESEGGLWIYKPASSNRGRGISVVKSGADVKNICFPSPPAESDDCDVAPGESPSRKGKARLPAIFMPDQRGVVQRYIQNPLLMNKRKFDIRCYCLVARNHPKYLVFYHPGYCRLTNKDYTNDEASICDNTIHLTNNAIQKGNANYLEAKESLIQTPAALADAVEKEGNASAAEYVRTKLDHDIKRCMVDVIKAGKTKMQRKHGYFDLFGLDFMITEENKLILLECNTNPALALTNSVLEAMLPGVVDGAIELVLGSQGPDIAPGAMEGDKELLANLPPGFELIYDESNGFEYK